MSTRVFWRKYESIKKRNELDAKIFFHFKIFTMRRIQFEYFEFLLFCWLITEAAIISHIFVWCFIHDFACFLFYHSFDVNPHFIWIHFYVIQLVALKRSFESKQLSEMIKWVVIIKYIHYEQFNFWKWDIQNIQSKFILF